MTSKFRTVAGAIAALSLATSSTAAMASTPAASPAPSALAGNSWTALSMMTAGSAYAADIRDESHEHARGPMPLMALAVILATIAVGIWIALDKANDHAGALPVSPK